MPHVPHPLDYATPPKPVQHPRRRFVPPNTTRLAGIFGTLLLYYGIVSLWHLLRHWRFANGQDVIGAAAVIAIAIVCLAIGFRSLRRPRLAAKTVTDKKSSSPSTQRY